MKIIPLISKLMLNISEYMQPKIKIFLKKQQYFKNNMYEYNENTIRKAKDLNIN